MSAHSLYLKFKVKGTDIVRTGGRTYYLHERALVDYLSDGRVCLTTFTLFPALSTVSANRVLFSPSIHAKNKISYVRNHNHW